ncbi:MAG: cobalamin-binding protein [Syntrophomonadaceae bacterium]|mgnify:CR=1 FL=1|nr:cobalamin-binding protein [Syntrophomonadaceae bacterium]
MYKSRTIPVLLLLMGLVLIGGCSTRSSAPPIAEDKPGYPVTINDDLGRRVTIAKEPQRIVSLSPSNTEILYAIGLGSRMVGVTTYCNYPEAALECEKIGGFSDPNLEMIIALEPDLVVAESIHGQVIPSLEKAGITVLVVEPRRLADIAGAVEVIGRAAGTREEAHRLAGQIRDKIEQIRSRVAGVENHPLVYFEIWHQPPMTAGPGTLIDDLITVCGGINLAADAVTSYPEISEEVIFLRNPEVIVYPESHGDAAVNPMNRKGGWEKLKAVQSGRVEPINPDIVSRAGPRVIEAMDALLSIIHLELAL